MILHGVWCTIFLTKRWKQFYLTHSNILRYFTHCTLLFLRYTKRVEVHYAIFESWCLSLKIFVAYIKFRSKAACVFTLSTNLHASSLPQPFGTPSSPSSDQCSYTSLQCTAAAILCKQVPLVVTRARYWRLPACFYFYIDREYYDSNQKLINYQTW